MPTPGLNSTHADRSRPRRHRVAAAVAVLIALVGAAAACSSGSSEPNSPDRRDPSAAPRGAAPPPPTSTDVEDVSTLRGAKLRPTLIGRVEGIATGLAASPDGKELLVSQVTGQVRRFTISDVDGYQVPELQDAPALDLSTETQFDGQNRGLLGLTFDQDGSQLIASYTDLAGDVLVEAYPYRRGARVDTDQGRNLLKIVHPFSGLSGGTITLDRNGDVLLGMGDMDQKYTDPPAAQDPKLLLGAIIRIPKARVDGGTDRVSLVAKGIRNPWGLSVDPASGDIWFADVGGGITEEQNRIPHGATTPVNFGWPYYDGSKVRVADPLTGRVVQPPDGFTFERAVLERTHAYDICGGVGGVVARTPLLPTVAGSYLYGDLCSSEVRGLLLLQGKVRDDRVIADIGERVLQVRPTPDGAIYVLGVQGAVVRLDPPRWKVRPVVAPPSGGAFQYPEQQGGSGEAPTTTMAGPKAPDAVCALVDSFVDLQAIELLTPTELEQRLDRAVMVVTAAEQVAPVDLRDDLRTIGEIWTDGRRIAEEAGWNANDPKVKAYADAVISGKAPYEAFPRAINVLAPYLDRCDTKL